MSRKRKKQIPPSNGNKSKEIPPAQLPSPSLVVHRGLAISFVIGLGLIGWGILVFMGVLITPNDFIVSLPERTFLGLTYPVLFLLGFYLVLVSEFIMFLGTGTAQKTWWRWGNGFFVFCLLIGLQLIIYSWLTFLPRLNPYHTRLDYFLIGAIFLLVGAGPLIFQMTERGRYIVGMASVGCVLGGITLLLSLFILLGAAERSGISYTDWPLFYLHGGLLFLISGTLLYVIVTQKPLEESFPYLHYIAGSLIGVGVGIYLFPSIIYQGILPRSLLPILVNGVFYAFLAWGFLLMLVGLGFWTGIMSNPSLLSRLKGVWYSLVGGGGAQILAAAVLILYDSLVVDLTQVLKGIVTASSRPHIWGMTWDVFYFNGFVMTLFGLIPLVRILRPVGDVHAQN